MITFGVSIEVISYIIQPLRNLLFKLREMRYANIDIDMNSIDEDELKKHTNADVEKLKKMF